MESKEINKIEQDIFKAIKEKVKNNSLMEVEKIIEEMVKERHYLLEEWQIYYAVERIKEMLDEYTKNEIQPLSFKQEMSKPSGRIVFIVTTFWLVFSGVMIFFYFFGNVHTNEKIISIILFGFIGGISFIIKQIFKSNHKNSKK